MKAKRTEEIKRAVQDEWLCRYGHSSTIHGDNERSFIGEEMSSFCSENGIRYTSSTAYDKRQNGQVERAHRFLREQMEIRYLEDPKSCWVSMLPEIARVYNAGYVAPLQATPYAVVFRELPTSQPDIFLSLLSPRQGPDVTSDTPIIHDILKDAGISVNLTTSGSHNTPATIPHSGSALPAANTNESNSNATPATIPHLPAANTNEPDFNVTPAAVPHDGLEIPAAVPTVSDEPFIATSDTTPATPILPSSLRPTSVITSDVIQPSFLAPGDLVWWRAAKTRKKLAQTSYGPWQICSKEGHNTYVAKNLGNGRTSRLSAQNVIRCRADELVDLEVV